MKTNKLFAVAAMLPVLFSCAKEEIKTNDNFSGDGQKYDFTITVSGDEDSITKASLSDETGIFWVKGGKAGIVKDSYNKESEELDDANITKDEYNHYQATFQFKGVDEGSYKLYYPYREGSVLDNIHFCVDLYQTTNVGKSADCFALVSDDMVSLKAGYQGIPATTTYKVVGSYIRFLVYGKENEQVKSIAIKCENTSRIAGEYYVDGTNNSLKGVYYNGEDIILDLQGASCPTTLGKDDSQGLYAAILPSSTDYPKAKNTYVVTTDGGFYTFKSASEKEFAFGSIKTLPLNLTKATSFSKTPEHLYIVGGATEIGWSCENAIELTKVDGKNQFEIKNIKLNAGSGDSGFKFLTTKGSWSKVYVNGLNNNKTITYYEDPVRANNDTKFFVNKAGYYDLVVDFDKNEITVKEAPKIFTYPDAKQTETYMSFTGTENIYKGIVYIPSGSGKHDFKVFFDGKYYHPGNWQEVSFGSAQSNHNLGYDWDVVANDTDNGWYLSDDDKDANRYYEITLDLTNPAEGKVGKVSAKLAQGSNFWLVGAHYKGADGNWAKHDDYKRTVENGVVTWNVTINVKEGEKSGFYIAGEYDTEAYFSDTQLGTYWEWNGYTYGGEQYVTYRKKDGFKSWAFTEAGDYTVEFRPAELKIKVTKK